MPQPWSLRLRVLTFAGAPPLVVKGPGFDPAGAAPLVSKGAGSDVPLRDPRDHCGGRFSMRRRKAHVENRTLLSAAFLVNV